MCRAMETIHRTTCQQPWHHSRNAGEHPPGVCLIYVRPGWRRTSERLKRSLRVNGACLGFAAFSVPKRSACLRVSGGARVQHERL